MPEKIKNYGKIFFLMLLAVLFLSGFFVFARHDVLAQSSASDAIAVRVIANPEHLSPLSWYQGKGFSGSPSPITVDGYQAIQDGRTVYVNVANVDPDTNKFYTNIYLISYNQNASADTSEIFSRILSNWKFNTNLTVPGYCFAACTTDNDCPAGSSCNATRCQQDCQKDADCSAASSCLAGHCRQSCLEDSDCGSNSFCDSQKANVIRDTVRLAEINDLKAAIEASQKRTGHYPLLTSGTFIPGQTISTWPSWKGEFASELGKSVPLDPINRLGYCDPAIYDPATCWDAAGQSLPPDMSIPDGLFNSSVFAYAVADQGKSYHACAVMQSGFLIGYDDDACPGSVSNIPAPTISCGNLIGEVGKDFTAYITAANVNKDPMSFSFSTLPNGVKVLDNANPNIKTITSLASALTSPLKNFAFTVSVTDTKTGQVGTQDCVINISAQANVIYPVADQKVQVGHNITFPVYAVSTKKNYDGLTITFNNAPPHFVCGAVTVGSDGRAKCTVNFATAYPFPKTSVTITANDKAGDSFTSQQFNLEIDNDPPVVQSLANCKTSVRVNNAYAGCKITAVDPNGDKIAHIDPASALPAGMTLATNGSTMGTLSGTPTVSGVYNLSFTATDLYGATGQPQSFTLNVNTYCGDKVKESPNMENAGGPSKNGYEDCDGTTPSVTPAQSNASNQYSVCNTDCSIQKNGFCGDGISQDGLLNTEGAQQTVNGLTINHTLLDYGEKCDFNGDINCCKTCQWVTGPQQSVSLPDTGVLGSGTGMNINLPANRGLGTMSFTAYPNIILDDLSGQPIAIAIISDISNPPNSDPVSGTIANMKIGLDNMIDGFYGWSQAKNEDVYVGAFGFGAVNTLNDPVATNFHYLTPLGNLHDPKYPPYSGSAQQANLEDDISNYVAMGDGSSGAESYIDTAIPQAKTMLDGMPANYLKYMIVVSDGCSCGDWDTPTAAAATAAKKEGIKIYTVSYYDKTLEKGDMCTWSSDNGDATKCYQNNYSYLSNNSGTDMTEVLSSIQTDILSNIPQQFSMTASLVGGGSVESAPLKVLSGGSTTVTLNLAPLLSCDISGVGCATALTLMPNFSGHGQVGVDTIKLNLLPGCQQ